MDEVTTEADEGGGPAASRGRSGRVPSLRARVTGLAVVMVTLVLVVGGWTLTRALRGALVDDVATVAALRSQDLAALAAGGALTRPIPIGDADEAMVQVVRDGGVVAASANAVDLLPLDVPAPPVDETVVAQRDSLPVADPQDRGGFVVAASTVATEEGRTTVYVASSLEDISEALEAAVDLGAVALPIFVAVLGAGIWVLVGRTLSPVEAIRAEADAISGADLHRRVPEPPSQDEVARLARTLNDMLGRLEVAAGRQRRFVADAAHELRTPIASIRTGVETARSSRRPVDWDDVSRAVLDDTIRMQQLTEQLLLLARVDAGRLHAQFREVDLDDVVVETTGRQPPVDGVTLEVTTVQPVRMTGEPVLLAQVVTNLLDNAVTHARGRVAVALHRERDSALLTVDDDGPGIPADDRSAVFERFTRLDHSRARGHRGGAGLGLALVADIVEAHGGTVHAGDSPLGGARFTVRLPAGDR